jgi:hypothetical protein
MNEVTGELQNIKKDFKAVQIEGIWYSSFKPLTDLQKGQTVKILYLENKGFKNIKTIEIIPQVKPVITKELYNIPDTTVNTIIMCSKEIYLNLFNKGTEIPLSEITEDVIESYKLIRNL